MEDLQTNLDMMENTEFEEKVDIDDLVFPSKPINLSEIEIQDIKQEPLEEEEQHAVFEANHDLGIKFKLKMEENILKLYEVLDKEKSENSIVDFSLRRSLKIKQFVEQHEKVNHKMKSEIVLLKTKIEEITDENGVAMSLNAETMANKIKELANNKQELQSVKVTNKKLLQKIQELEMNKNTFANKESLEKNHEIKAFSCKFCDKSFHQAQEVKEHIKIHTTTILEVEEETSFMYDDKNCLTNDHSNTMQIPRENNSKIPLKRENMAFQSNNGACELCDKTYKNIESLRRHKRKAHTEIENLEEFSCQHCNKKFKFQIDLSDHLRIHRGKIKCNICSVKFTRRDNLLKHQRKIHNNKTKIS